MAGITLRTARQVVPMIYAYTTPEIARHNGWTKIGYTEQSVDKRLKQQTHTADVLYHEEWRGNAVYDDGSGEVFTDHDFHAYLRKLNVENDRKNEWFHLDGQQSRRYFQDFRMNRGRVQLDAAIAYTLREEQARAVRDTKTYYRSHPGGEYLWNAKPRFGKTLSVYDFCKQVDAQTVLIVTNRPAIANSWYSDYVRFLGRESGYLFVSHVDALSGQPHVLHEDDFATVAMQDAEHSRRIEFVSLQDMKGAEVFGGEYKKLEHLTRIQWDVLVIDEAHEGVDLDESTPHIHERHVFDCENKYGEMAPQQEKALEALGFDLPDPNKPLSRRNNRKIAFDAACRKMLFEIAKRHGLELEEEAEYGNRKYLEKQDFILAKQKEQLAAQQSKLDELTLKVSDMETLIDEVSVAAYDKAVEVVTDVVRTETRKEDMRMIEDTKKWVLSPERKAPQSTREYAAHRLDPCYLRDHEHRNFARRYPRLAGAQDCQALPEVRSSEGLGARNQPRNRG